MDNNQWKNEMPLFEQKTNDFYNGVLKPNEYKGFSGFYGSYAQKGGKASMLRLRMTAGKVTKDKLNYVITKANEFKVDTIHFTTCQAIQFHNLNKEAVYNIMEGALDHDIITFGGGGDFPRNIMCSPLSGVEKGENFDVMPYALEAGKYLMKFIKAEKMPRKLKVGFSSSPTNEPHVTFRDLGFVANKDHTFDVYSAGGLGNNPRFGVKVASKINPNDILYYIKAMWLTFRAYGNYENRAKARTRYMVEALGGEENYKKAYLEKLEEAKKEDLGIHIVYPIIFKAKDGIIHGNNIIEQKQEGLYAVKYHPLGGKPSLAVLTKLNDAIQKMDKVEMRIGPDETAYIINLTGNEARVINDIVDEDNAKTLFETSVSCIGATICQVGLRDSQGLLMKCINAVRNANIANKALPCVHISGCPSSCGSHQTNILSFRGNTKIVDKKPVSAFSVYVGGIAIQGKEAMASEIGIIAEDRIPEFLVEIGHAVENSKMDYTSWYYANPQLIKDIASKYF